MRKTEARMIQAIREALNDSYKAGRLLKCGNTEVTVEHHGIGGTFGHYRLVEIRLHGHRIGLVEPEIMRLSLFDCGYRTATTKSRLNALLRAFVPGEGISQADWEWYTRLDAWDGSGEWRMRLDADNWFLQQAERLAA